MYKMIIATSSKSLLHQYIWCLSNFVMLYVYWVENDDLKTIAWKEQDLNAMNSIQKKVWLGNQMMLILIFFVFSSNLTFLNLMMKP